MYGSINKFLWMKWYSLFLTIFAVNGLTQPTLLTPQPSPEAQITQEVGISKVTIRFHRPAVRGRAIWGDLVPYEQVWRAGANENTTIQFSDPVKVEGKDLAAGIYGLHMIPGKNDWIIIFSTINTAWGSFGYNSDEDALRVIVMPESSPFEERLSYRFDNPTRDNVTIALYWEKLRIPFRVTFDVNKIVLNKMRQDLRGQAQFFWQSWNQAANYCLQNNLNHEEALNWVNRSIGLNENFSNLRVKSGLLEQQGQKVEAKQLMDKALNIATENEINQYGYQLLFAGKVDEAIKIFQKNVKDHPDSWNVYDSLGEAYLTKGDKKKALENYRKAFEMVEDETQKNRIAGILESLKK